MALLNIINDLLKEAVEQGIQQKKAEIERIIQYEQSAILHNPNLTAYEKEVYLERINQIRAMLFKHQCTREKILNIADLCNELSKLSEKMSKK